MEKKEKTLVVLGNGFLASKCTKLFHDHPHFEVRHVAVDLGPRKYGTGLEVMVKKLGLSHSLEANLASGDFITKIDEIQPDYLLSICNSQVIFDEALTNVGVGINFHNAPLPKYAGSNACSWALAAGENYFGVTFHKIVKRVDAGDIVFQRTFPISPTATAIELNTRCLNEGYRLLADNLALFSKPELPASSQNLSERTFNAANAVPNDGWINVEWGLTQVLNFVRAFDYLPLRGPFGSPKLRVRDSFIFVQKAADAKTASTMKVGAIEIIGDQVWLHLCDGVAALTTVADENYDVLSPNDLKRLL